MRAGRLTVGALIDAGTGDVSLGPSINGLAHSIQNLGLYRQLRTSGIVTIGQATTAGTDGLGTGQLILTDGSTTLDVPLQLSSTFAGEVRFITQDGFTLNQSLTTSQPIIINANADGDNEGAIVTSAGATLTPGGPLALIAGAGIDITTQNLGLIAAQTASGNIIINNNVDSSGFEIGQVGDLSGIHTNGGDVVLTSFSPVTQTAPIVAAGLELLGNGPYTLTHPGNDVDTLAASTSGSIEYVDANALTVGLVNETAGIETFGDNVSIRTLDGGCAYTSLYRPRISKVLLGMCC